MRSSFPAFVSAFLVCFALACLAPLMTVTAEKGLGELPHAPFVPTPEAVVDEMLEIAKVSAKDVVYDLGSGDGRILIAAAKRFGARGVGIEINPDLLIDAGENATQAGVAHLVRFAEADFFTVDLSEATVVTLYLLPEVNRLLLPKLLAELRPGTRIVSYKYDLGDWAPEKTVRVSRGTVYYWVVPPARIIHKGHGNNPGIPGE
jgi:SAM-dependent methyltransferase